MRMKSFIIWVAVFALTAAAGCGHLETYGERVSGQNITAVKDILTRPQDYNGKTVTVKGKIAIECETGCWFNFKQGDAVIYVDLGPSGFAIPQKAGRDATVEGNVAIKEGKPRLIGKGVEIR